MVWKKARKKPVEIEFREVQPKEDIYVSIYKDGKITRGLKKERGEIIHTLEGDHKAVVGVDFIIRGVKGETYPIKRDIFYETYEVLEK